MKIRTICTTVFVLARTIFSHVWIAGAIFFITLLLIHIFTTQKNKKDRIVIILGISLLFISITLSFLLHTWSFTLSSFFYHQQNSLLTNIKEPLLSPTQNSIFTEKNLTLTPINTTSPTTFIWTGQIIELQREWRYTLKTVDSTYLLSTKTILWLWDTIRVSGRFTPAKKTIIQTELNFSSLTLPTLFTWWFDYTQWMVMKWVAWDIQTSKITILNTPTPLPRILALRIGILNIIQSTFWKTPAGWLLQWMLIWDRSWIPKEKYEQFISSWMVHIVAVSGSNILYVVLFLNIVLFFIPYYIRTGIIIIAIVFYALICGLDSSVIRAVIMWILTLIAILWGRVVSAWRLLAIAWIAILVWNPLLLLYDLWFLLSFSALVGILIISKVADRLPTNNKTTTLLKSYILPSIGAWVGTLPILLFFVGTTNIASIFANIFIVPIVPFVLLWGVVAVFIDNLFSLNSYIDILFFPFEMLYWLARRLTVNGIYLSTELWRTRHLLSAWLLIVILLFAKLTKQNIDQERLDSNQD